MRSARKFTHRAVIPQENDLRSMGDKMNNVCIQYGCTKCCMNTRMPLSNSDITRIKELGFLEDFFALERNGGHHLKNVSGRCVFHNGKQCTIYKDRPEGCRLYPAVFDENEGKVILHLCCPHHGKFHLKPQTSCEVINLIRKLDMEKRVG